MGSQRLEMRAKSRALPQARLFQRFTLRVAFCHRRVAIVVAQTDLWGKDRACPCGATIEGQIDAC